MKKENNQWFHDILNRGLETFVKYWDYERIEKRWKEKGVCSNGDIYVKRDVERLQDAISYDETGLTAYMMLRAYLYRLLKNTSFSAFDLIVNWESEKVYLEKFAEMRAELEEPDALKVYDEFKETLREMTRHYEAKNADGIEAVLSDKIALPFLRFSALQSFEKKLKPYQFLQGDGTKEKLFVHKKVYEFWNINSLINAAARQLFDGVALCVIRDPEHFFASFFCIAIKAGETLTVLTDRFKGAHPRYNEMSRRPDRDFDERAGENWFPYQLLGAELSADGKRLFEKKRESLVPFQTELVPIADIGELEPEQVLWLGFLLDLTAKRFGGEKPLQLPALTYTGEMIRTPDALVPPSSSLILQGKYKPLDLPALKPEEITAEKTAANFEKPSYGINRHVFDRFKDQVPPEVYNIVGAKEVKLLQETGGGLLQEKVATTVWRPKETEPKIELRHFSPLDFGTPEELEKDRVWTARFNQISYIKALAEKEFNETRAEVCAWYEEKVRANVNNLLYAAATMEMIAEVGLWKSDWSYRMKFAPNGDSFPSKDEPKISTENLLKIWSWKKVRGIGLWNYRRKEQGDVPFAEEKEYAPYYYCYGGGLVSANVAAVFTPSEASHLAIFAGCEVEDLPPQIRYWKKNAPYVGNSILDRLDPEDWYLKDFFRNLDFHVSFAFSKSYFNNLRKNYGFEKVDWSLYEKE